MPSTVVKTPADERYWKNAKAQAEKEGHAKDWKYVMSIFKRMKHHSGGKDVEKSEDYDAYDLRYPILEVLKDGIEKYKDNLQKMREREVNKLAKHKNACVICGRSEFPCGCYSTLAKSEIRLEHLGKTEEVIDLENENTYGKRIKTIQKDGVTPEDKASEERPEGEGSGGQIKKGKKVGKKEKKKKAKGGGPTSDSIKSKAGKGKKQGPAAEGKGGTQKAGAAEDKSDGSNGGEEKRGTPKGTKPGTPKHTSSNVNAQDVLGMGKRGGGVVNRPELGGSMPPGATQTKQSPGNGGETRAPAGRRVPPMGNKTNDTFMTDAISKAEPPMAKPPTGVTDKVPTSKVGSPSVGGLTKSVAEIRKCALEKSGSLHKAHLPFRNSANAGAEAAHARSTSMGGAEATPAAPAQPRAASHYDMSDVNAANGAKFGAPPAPAKDKFAGMNPPLRPPKPPTLAGAAGAAPGKSSLIGRFRSALRSGAPTNKSEGNDADPEHRILWKGDRSVIHGVHPRHVKALEDAKKSEAGEHK